MRANNPSAAAKLELRCLWPQTPRPHVLVSVGTGFSNQGSTDAGAERGLLRDGFIPRVFRGFMSSPFVDGDSGWLSVIESLSAEEKRRHYRLSFQFIGDAPMLDDAPAMPLLESQASVCPQDHLGLVRRLWASRFFIEFQSEPVYCLGEYQCRAKILFQGEDIRSLITLICQKHRFPQIKVGNRVATRLHQYDGVCVACGGFQQQLEFRVRRLDESISLVLAYDSTLTVPLPGHGESAKWFLKRQKLHGNLRRWLAGCSCCVHRNAVADNGALRGGRKRKAAELQ